MTYNSTNYNFGLGLDPILVSYECDKCYQENVDELHM